MAPTTQEMPWAGPSRWPSASSSPSGPGEGAIAVVWAIGLYAIVFGVALLVLGVQLRQLRRRIKGTPRMP